MLRHTGHLARERTVPTPLAQFAARSFRKFSPYGEELPDHLRQQGAGGGGVGAGLHHGGIPRRDGVGQRVQGQQQRIVPRAHNQDNVQEIVERQRRFFRTGATLPVSFRLAMLKELRDAVDRYEEEIGAALAADLGKSGYESFMRR